MSKLETNQVDPATGTTLTLGTSGDTIAIPSGVTIANSGTATGFGGANTPAFLVQGHSSGQTLSSGTWTKVTDWVNVYDTASGFDLTNDKFTIPSGQGGKYFVYGFIKYGAASTRRIQVAVYKNGSINQAASGYTEYYSGVHLGVAISLAASDYIEIYCKIDNGGGGQIMTDNTSERFGAFKLIE